MAIFQHRHYCFLAKAISEAVEKNESVQTLVATLAKRFKEDNPRFDAKRFLDASFGVTSRGKDNRTMGEVTQSQTPEERVNANMQALADELSGDIAR